MHGSNRDTILQLCNRETKKGCTTSTDPIYFLCYDGHDIVSSSEIKWNRNVGGKNPLPLFQHYYDGTKIIVVPTSGGCSNSRESSDQKRAEKKRMHSRGA